MFSVLENTRQGKEIVNEKKKEVRTHEPSTKDTNPRDFDIYIYMCIYLVSHKKGSEAQEDRHPQWVYRDFVACSLVTGADHPRTRYTVEFGSLTPQISSTNLLRGAKALTTRRSRRAPGRCVRG